MRTPFPKKPEDEYVPECVLRAEAKAKKAPVRSCVRCGVLLNDEGVCPYCV